MERAVLIARYPGYSWMKIKGLVGFEPRTPLEPWYFTQGREMFWVNEVWPNGPSDTDLLVFARRQDNDDLACLEVSPDAARVVLIEGWQGRSYEIVTTYPSFWDWLKSVVDDIANVVSRFP